MSYDYSEKVLVQDSAGNLLRDELGWEVAYAYNTEKLSGNRVLELLLASCDEAEFSANGSPPTGCSTT